MSIENGPAPTGAKVTATENGNAKGKHSTASHSGGHAPSGFSAILESLGADAAPATGAGNGAGATAESPDATVAADPTLDPAALLAQSLQAVTPVAGEAINASAHVQGAKGTPLQKAGDAASSTLAQYTQTELSELKPSPRLSNGRHEASAKSPVTGAGEMAANLSGDAGDGRKARFTAELAIVNAQAPAADPAPVVAVDSAQKPVAEKSMFKLENDHNTPAATPTGSAAVSTTTSMSAPDGGVTADFRVAEQVTYWISQDVQKAEMKLDGVGDKPVEVSISMHGNEAHVAFRTDELQTREVLESASAHLKDMLQREGLMLSGMSVGTSGGGAGGNGQERRPRQEGRQALVEVPTTGGIVPRASGGAGPGRAVDLFV